MDTHLKGIGVENFRVFKDDQYFDFAPITILTGTNSSGKSSLINLLKLLSETYKGISWKDREKENFDLSNFMDTEITKDWCIKKFGNLNNLSNKFNKEKNGFCFSQLVDMPGYENTITLKIIYEFDLLKQNKYNNSLKRISILINDIKKTKIIKDYVISLKEVGGNIDGLILKEIFTINFDKSKMSNSKLALDILYPLFIHKSLYEASVKEEISKFQAALNIHDAENIRQQIAAFMKMHELKYQIDHITINKKNFISINAENYLYKGGFFKNVFSKTEKLEQEFEVKALSTDERNKRPLCLIDAWCSFDSRKINKIDRLLIGIYGDELSNCHRIFYTEVFKILSDVVWNSDVFDDERLAGTDTSYIYFGTSYRPFDLKDSNGFSLKDFIKRAFNKNHKEIYNEEWWLNEENKMFYTPKNLNKDFIKKVFLPVIKIIFEGIIIKETFVFDEFELTSDMQNEWLTENNLQDNEDAIADLKSISRGYSNYFQTSKLERVFYGLFIYDIIKLVFNPIAGLKIIDSIANHRSYDSRVVSVLDKDETSLRIAKNTLDEEKLEELKIFWKKHLQEFDIAEDIKIDIDRESMYYKIFLLVNGEWVNLKDLGFGVSQIIPLLLSLSQEINTNWMWAYEVDGNEYLPIIMLIEEPEANLHPALQSKLANFFVEAAEQFNIQFIIETHSEYLIRKLQYLTAKKVIKPEDTQVYYFHHPDRIPGGEDQIYRINIKADGSLTKDFGKGFFDEADNIALELFLLKAHQNN